MNRTHGQTGTRLYEVWKHMKSRCLCPTNARFKDYGGRGIMICDEWLHFETFLEWARATGYDEKAPRGAYTIDRIDNDGDYTPENCKWSTYKEQNKNRRRKYEADTITHRARH